MKLYQITEQFKSIEDLLIESGGELTPDIEKALEINKKNKDSAFKNLMYLMMEKEDEVASLDSRIKELANLKKQKETTRDSCKKAILNGVLVFGEQKVDEFTLGTRKSKSTDTIGLVYDIEKMLPHIKDMEKRISEFKQVDVMTLAALSGLTEERITQIIDFIPEGLVKEVFEINYKPDKTMLKKAIEGGREIEGVNIIENQNLKIK